MTVVPKHTGLLRGSRTTRTRGLLALATAMAALAAQGALGTAAPTARAAEGPRSEIVVPRDFPSIQAAVDAAPSGGTVTVRAGTYTEEVVVSGKELRLKGAGARKTVIKSPATLTPFAVNTRDDLPTASIVRIAGGARVRMSGFTVTGPIPCAVGANGITALQGSTLELTDSHVPDVHPDASCPGDRARGRGVVFGLPPFVEVGGVPGSTASGLISHVTVERYLIDGINIGGPAEGGTRVEITDNTVTGGARFPVAQAGIAVASGATGKVTGNRVSDTVCTLAECGPDPIAQIQSAGIITAFDPASGSVISENRVSASDIGVYLYASPDCCRISGNHLKGNKYFGIAIQDGNGTTDRNTISGGQVGIGVIADSADTTGTLRGDRISGTTVAPVRETECCGYKATAVVRQHDGG
ncbi:right-handed parallel beta-helix repeat-containing protein [Streptomyces sp. NPDC089915]|uniref:right-handed parallel beta-helix repeat-containing protein n=1 Tax=Streptomyces sp. NPDC089915 TaxID=3155186 RepID=UPI0034350196